MYSIIVFQRLLLYHNGVFGSEIVIKGKKNQNMIRVFHKLGLEPNDVLGILINFYNQC